MIYIYIYIYIIPTIFIICISLSLCIYIYIYIHTRMHILFAPAGGCRIECLALWTTTVFLPKIPKISIESLEES